MSRKDYILIAEAIKEIYDYQKDSDGKGSRAIKRGAIRMVVNNLCDALWRDNNKFDRDRFFRACGCDVE